jgi:hypothetical protein
MKKVSWRDRNKRNTNAQIPKTSQSEQHGIHRKAKTSSDFRDALDRILLTLTLIATIPVRIFVWLTNEGRAFPLGLAVIYFAAINIEGYWMAFPGDNPAFLPKPFVDDGANLLNLPVVVLHGAFWVAAILSTLIAIVQAKALRDISPQDAKHAYEEVKDLKVPNHDPYAIDLAEHRRRIYKSSGMRRATTIGLLCFSGWVIDFVVQNGSFPLLPFDAKNLIWLFISVFAAEFAIAIFLDAIDDLKQHGKKHPKVEVLN